MRALSLLAPVLALVSVEAEPPTDDDLFNQYSCDANQRHDVIEIRANVRTPFFAAVIALTGDGWSDGSYSESEVKMTLFQEVQAPFYELPFDEVFETFNGLNSGTYPARYGAEFYSDAVLDDRVRAVIVADIDDDPTDCDDGANCIPPSRGLQTIIRVPVCWTMPASNPNLYYSACLDAASEACGVCVDVENSLFITGIRAPTPTGDPSSGDPTPSATPELELNDLTLARVRSTGCRSIEVYLESEEGEDGGGDVESEEGDTEDGGGDDDTDGV
jgi:hypothetical protein